MLALVASERALAQGDGLAAIPARSRQLWRLDFALPLSADAHAGWELRLTGLGTRGVWREPSDVARIRAGAAPATIFAWPNYRSP